MSFRIREGLDYVGLLYWWRCIPAVRSCFTPNLLIFLPLVEDTCDVLLNPRQECYIKQDVCFLLFCFILCFVRCFIPMHSLSLCQEISELKEQIEDVEGKYMQGLKEMKVLACVALIFDRAWCAAKRNY